MKNKETKHYCKIEDHKVKIVNLMIQSCISNLSRELDAAEEFHYHRKLKTQIDRLFEIKRSVKKYDGILCEADHKYLEEAYITLMQGLGAL